MKLSLHKLARVVLVVDLQGTPPQIREHTGTYITLLSDESLQAFALHSPSWRPHGEEGSIDSMSTAPSARGGEWGGGLVGGRGH